MRRGLRTFLPDNKEDRHTCTKCFSVYIFTTGIKLILNYTCADQQYLRACTGQKSLLATVVAIIIYRRSIGFKWPQTGLI